MRAILVQAVQSSRLFFFLTKEKKKRKENAMCRERNGKKLKIDLLLKSTGLYFGASEHLLPC